MNLATSTDEDNPVVKGLREALDALIAEDEEITETLDEVFSEPSTPVVNKLVRLASKLSMNKHPKPLLRAQTDLGFRLMRQNTFQMEKPVTPTSGLPLSAELQRKKLHQNVLQHSLEEEVQLLSQLIWKDTVSSTLLKLVHWLF